ncbi:MAG TPA: long-chain fatty acid--CoA ligase [Pyrinomonadaceae bacterium]|jgi:long-chain acyl-CoA synthetase|nr:long-chain fatty acid--CoA ligase [Pyrinomonadaceae bacterium]
MSTESLFGDPNIPLTIPHFCLAALRKYNKSDAMNHKIKKDWVGLSAEEVIRRVKWLALGLAESGIKEGDHVALISENRPEWSLVDLALLSLRAVSVPLYTTQAVDQIRYILEDSGAKAILLSGKKIFKHIQPALEGVESLEKVIYFDNDGVGEETPDSLALSEIEKRGEAADELDEKAYERLLEKVHTEDLATIIYTSGTTGEPKGVMLTHENFTSNILCISDELPFDSSDRSLSVLPLSHIFERVVFYVLCSNGVSIHYSASFDHLAEHLQEVKPTIMTAVPRLFEKVYHKIVRKGMTAGGWKTKLFTWALDVGQQYWKHKDERKPVPAGLAAKQAIASRLVFSRWRDAVGGSLRFFVSGGAPLSKKLSYAFWAANIPILQGYGMTEACVVSANRPDDQRSGSIGRPFAGIEMTIGNEGEILIRGKNVMSGYYNKPELTAQAIDAEGWYHSGDVGYIGDDGHVYITDRLKDLFKLSNGKYIAPQQVESLLKQSPLVGQAVVVGSGRKQTGALIVPDWEALRVALTEKGLSNAGTKEELSKKPEVVKFVQREMSEMTKELSDYERVKKVALLPREFSIEKGEMTPTLKIKRGVIDEKYNDLIDEICGGGAD